MLRRFKLAKCAAALLFGGLLTQVGPCTVIAGQTALTAGAGNLIGDDGSFLFIFNVCGVPNTIVIDATGNASEILNTEDDLFFGCPVTIIEP